MSYHYAFEYVAFDKHGGLHQANSSELLQASLDVSNSIKVIDLRDSVLVPSEA